MSRKAAKPTVALAGKAGREVVDPRPKGQAASDPPAEAHPAVTEERILRTFVSETAFPMAMFDREMRYLAVSRAWISDYGLEGESVLGRSHYEVFPEISGDWKAVHREGMEGASVRRDEDRFERDGSVQWLRWEVRPWKRSDDSIGGIVIISEDITERKTVEQDLLHAKETLEERVAERALALAESEERFRLFMDHSPAVAWVKDEAGRYVYLNRTLGLRFGVSLADWQGKTDADLWPRDVAEAFRRNDLAALESDRSIEFVEQSPNPDGTLCSWLNVKFPFRDAAGRRFVGGVGVDVTTRIRAEEALRDSDRRKDEFLALLGHELRNPLAAISTALQVLPGAIDDEERAELMQVMTRQVSMMRRLMDDLLDVERIRRGHVELTWEAVDLGEFLYNVSAGMRTSIAERHQELLLGVPTGCPEFLADRMRLGQIVTNLLSNASKYSPPGSRIELTGALEGSEIVIRCRDFGQGIPPENLARIFEPFTRGPKTELGYGEASLGIGLALARQLTELHGGWIEASSEGAGLGSRFAIRLPLRARTAASDRTPAATPVPSSRGSRCIVIVEDNPTVAALMRTALLQAGKEVHAFADAPSALAAIEGLRPDTVLLDVGLPGMDGYELASRLREYPHLRAVRLVAISGFEARKPGEPHAQVFDHYLLKPVNVAELLTLVDTPVDAAPSDAPQPKQRPEGPIRTLLVEDHPSLAAVTASMLRQEGMDVRIAESGDAALRVSSEFRPDLVLCDLNLPGMSGIEVIRRLKSDPGACPFRSVIVTGTDASEMTSLRRKAANLGIDEFVTKPLDVGVVRGIVSRIERTG